MRILLQNCGTLQFLKSLGCWTNNAGDAMEFKSSNEALDFCFLHRQELGEIQIVMKFSDGQYDIAFPVTEGCRDALEDALRAIQKRTNQ